MDKAPQRRGFVKALGGAVALASGQAAMAQAAGSRAGGATTLPGYARAQSYRSLKQSSFDRTGGNEDFWPIAAGQTKQVFEAAGPGVITHIWFTIAAESRRHLKELVLRIYWEGNSKPSVETPIGDFFGLNMGEYTLYQSAFLNCSNVKALNCYFAMPFRRSAQITVTNEGEKSVGAFYSNIDYQMVAALPEDAVYFHAQYRQAAPARAVQYDKGEREINLDGQNNYVFLETQGRGHLMGVTMGVEQIADGWFGEGDEMIFIDDNSKPAINGTGTEDYFCGAWDFGGPAGTPFANLYNGAPFMGLAERAGGRYALYRWHADNPITFERSLRYTIEHGHADDRSDHFCSVAYWYQSEPYTDFPALAPAPQRVPQPKENG
ncbi:MAG: DUF2961 domain-containing protein [Acidobacteriaceae bacterium]|nr:DUF2961 domain-containing protein [Acidobacteriaceae bacterium]